MVVNGYIEFDFVDMCDFLEVNDFELYEILKKEKCC